MYFMIDNRKESYWAKRGRIVSFKKLISYKGTPNHYAWDREKLEIKVDLWKKESRLEWWP